MTIKPTISPTDIEFYANHDTAVLEALSKRLVGEGAMVAATSGADHPIAVEYAAMVAAVIGELMRRDLDRIIEAVKEDA